MASLGLSRAVRCSVQTGRRGPEWANMEVLLSIFPLQICGCRSVTIGLDESKSRIRSVGLPGVSNIVGGASSTWPNKERRKETCARNTRTACSGTRVFWCLRSLSFLCRHFGRSCRKATTQRPKTGKGKNSKEMDKAKLNRHESEGSGGWRFWTKTARESRKDQERHQSQRETPQRQGPQPPKEQTNEKP